MNGDPQGRPDALHDQVLGFAMPDRDCRGRLLRLGPVLDTILSAHDYPQSLRVLLAEALTLTGLMGGLLKGARDQLTLQAQTPGGVVTLLVCDYRGGELRGYVKHDQERFASSGDTSDLATMFGEGRLAITFHMAESGQRYQGIVPLEGASLTEAVEAYFARSEQIPTLIRTAVGAKDGKCVAGGMLIQHLAHGEEGGERLHAQVDQEEWDHVTTIASSVRQAELVDTSISLEALIWRLFHEEREVRVERITGVERGCRCSERHFEEVLARFPSEDRKDMRDDHGVILVDCAFCSREFAIQD